MTRVSDTQWRREITVDHGPMDAALGGRTKHGKTEVAVIRDEGDGSGSKLFNQDGDQIELPHNLPFPSNFKRNTGVEAAIAAGKSRPIPQLTTRLTTPNWLDSFLLTPEKAKVRRAVLERRYGVATESAAGVDQFRVANDSGTNVVFVDAATATIREVQSLVSGTLMRRTTFAYTPQKDGSLLRTSIQAMSVNPRTGQQRTSTITYSNVRLERTL